MTNLKWRQRLKKPDTRGNMRWQSVRRITLRCETCNIAVKPAETKPTASTQGLERVVGLEVGTKGSKTKPNISVGLEKAAACIVELAPVFPVFKRQRNGAKVQTILPT